MIPNIDLLTQEITEVTYYGRTYRIVFSNESLRTNFSSLRMTYSVPESTSDSYMDRISGYVDGLDSVIQAIYLILNTERYEFIIYSWDYGVELIDLFGKPIPYVIAELPRRIKDALIQDDRITDVTNFEFTKNGKKLKTTFTVITTVGEISTELEVEI